ncbi:DUF202 domain-containing protein [Pedococcus sp. 2YAF34]|uniref:DUF202 domain-containing protein n=1 Tax=Pedococcus sp. 2YAF34 TaxID=3233032 RepID=UPI003F9A87E6
MNPTRPNAGGVAGRGAGDVAGRGVGGVTRLAAGRFRRSRGGPRGHVPGRDALQPERTALAWQRTAVTALVCLVPLVLVSLRTHVTPVAVGAAAAMAVSGVLVWSVHRRLGQLGDDSRGYSPYTPMSLVLAVSVLCSLGGAVVGVSLWLR